MAAVFDFLFTIFFVIFLCSLDINDAINLDARFSVIKKGDTNSYFGFSVAQHQIVDENNPDRVLKNVLLVGSPKSGKTGGAIFQCNAETGSVQCTQITDGLPTKTKDTELLDDQWLGVSVASQGAGKKAVACAHRFIENNMGLGVCYVFTQDLNEVRFFFRPCQKVPHKLFMQDFGLCQAGMSAAIGQDDSLLMGAPGSVFWQGAVFLTNVTDTLGASQSEIESPYADPQQVTGNQQPTPTRPYSYQGYALAMGRFDASKDLYYVSGAPKGANAKGSVIFYKVFNVPQPSLRYEKSQIIEGLVPFSGFGSSLLAVDINNDGFDDLIVGAPYYYSMNRGGAFYVYLGGKEMLGKNSKPEVVLSRKLGDKECKDLACEHARFGISLAKLGDINMDSYQDFAVGAPYEGNGAVYIYHGQKEAPGFTVQYVQRITASDLSKVYPNIMSFGYSLSGGMDLDKNGYPDLLVGAYESDVVALIRSRPIIRIHPRMDVNPKLVDLEGTLKCTLKGVKPENENRLCVGVEICLNFTTKPEESIQLVPTVVYSIEAEKSRRIARVELQDAEDASKRIVKGKTIKLSKTNDECATEIAFIKGNFDDKLNPIEFTFHFHLSSDDEEPSPFPTSATQDINTFPILDTRGIGLDNRMSNDVAVKVDFVKECGDDQECHSNLQFKSELLKLPKDKEGNYELVIQKKNEIRISFDLENKGEPAYLTRVYFRKPSLVTYLETLKEDAASVSCQDVVDDDTMIMCDQIGNPLRTDKSLSFEVVLDVPKEMADSTDLYNITAWVNTSSSETTPVNDETILYFRVINKAEIVLSTYVNPDNSIRCEGEPRGASAIEDEEGIGHSVKHNFMVRNYGPGVISESYITISWPYEVAGGSEKEGKYLLYLMRKPKVIGPVIQCNDKEIEQYINPLKIKEVVKSEGEEAATGASMDPSNLILYDEDMAYKDGPTLKPNSRKKREADPRKRQGRVIVMSCLDKTAKCFQYKCKLGKMEPRTNFVRITMESRLWESTLLSEYGKAADVQIISWGNLTLPRKLMIQQDTADDMKRAITRAIPDFKETAGQKLQWWIILVAVLVGIILLLVVLLIMKKVGFFKKKRFEEMQMYKAEKKQQAMLSDYDDGE